MCWENIVKLFSKPVAKFPTSKGKISGNEVYTFMKGRYVNLQTYISDSQFDLCTVEEAKAYLDTEEKQPYLAEGHDCDNFSFASMGYFSKGLLSFAFGIAWTSTHAFNFMIDNNKQVWIVEPQSNRFMTIEEASKDSKYYPLTMILL